jgi:ribosomal protein S15P/S13E
MKSEGIHPRVLYGKEGVKLNTCNPPSRAKLERAIVGLERHIGTNPNDAACKTRLVNLQARLAAIPHRQSPKMQMAAE